MKEIELFPALQEMFKGYEIFAEVCVGGKRPDIVVRNGEEVSIIEMKTSLNTQLYRQAMHWKYHNISDYIYIAVPKPKRNNASTKARTDLLIENGIGIIYVDTTAEIVFPARKRLNPYKDIWKRVLFDCYKSIIGGSTSDNGYMTPYKHMINCIKKYLLNTGYKSTREIVSNVPEISDHYRNPTPSIRNALSNYEDSWCVRKLIGREVYFKANIKRIPIVKKNF